MCIRDRAGDKPDMIDGEMAAMVVDLLTGPQSEEDRKGFVEHGCPDVLLDGLPEALELATGVDPETHPESEPAMGEHVERHRLAGHLLGSTTRQRSDGGSESEALGGRGDGGEGDPRVPDRQGIAFRTPHVVPEEDLSLIHI